MNKIRAIYRGEESHFLENGKFGIAGTIRSSIGSHRSRIQKAKAKPRHGTTMNRIIDLYGGALINAGRSFEVRRTSWGLPESVRIRGPEHAWRMSVRKEESGRADEIETIEISLRKMIGLTQPLLYTLGSISSNSPSKFPPLCYRDFFRFEF